MAFRDLRRAKTEIDGPAEPSAAQSPDPDAGAATMPAAATHRRRFLGKAAAGGAIAFGATAVPLVELMPRAWAQEGGGATTESTTGGLIAPAPGGSAVPGTTAKTAGSTPGTTAASTKKKVEPKVTGNDLTLVVWVQTIELAAVDAYAQMIAAAKFTPELTQQARDFQRHHAEHADELGLWAGSEALHTANEALTSQLKNQITAATDQPGMATVANGLEEGMAATYQYLMGQIEDWYTAGVLATIEPIESQHAVVWTGTVEPDQQAWATKITTWIPNFQTTSDAFQPASYPAS